MIRLKKQIVLNLRAGPVALGETHIAHMMAWPWDIGVFLDLNNGRILTLMDLGRFGYFLRNGIYRRLRQKGWYGTVAGSVIRYRRRITMFQRLELRTKLVGWDARFIYLEQSFWRGDVCFAHAVVRTVITSGKGIVPTKDVGRVLGYPEESPELPTWITAWAAAELQRPWPPE